MFVPCPQRGRPRRPFASALAAALLAFCAPLQAASVRVNTTADTVDASPGDGICEANAGAGDCSLRAAIQETNALPGQDDIAVAGGSYLLDLIGPDEDAGATGDLDILGPLELTCEVDDACALDCGGSDRCLHVHSSARLILEGFVMTNGAALASPAADAGRGGLIAVQGAFTNLHRLTLRGGVAERGGAIAGWDGATIQAVGMKISGCRATRGGGVQIEDASTTFLASTISSCVADDAGGGICLDRAQGTFNDGVLRDNIAVIGGGAAMLGGSRASLEETIVVGNEAASRGGGISVEDGEVNLSVTRCEVNNSRDGGGAALMAGRLEVFKSSISGNTGLRGAGAWAGGGTINMINSTLMQNKASGGSGGGLLLSAPGAPEALFSFTTIVDNTALEGGGLLVEAGTATMLTTILHGNAAPTWADGGAADGMLLSRGYNIIGDPLGLPSSAWQPEDLLGVDPLLGAPSIGRGFSFGLPPLAGSPAIDAGDPAGCFDLSGDVAANDQQGERRATDGDANGVVGCDIGAIEWCGEDRDGNGVGDKCGCVVGDPGSIAVPPEALLLAARIPGVDHPLLTWTDLVGIAGPATTYEVAGESLDELWLIRSAIGPCRTVGLVDARWEDVPLPPDDQYYLVRGVNGCGPIATQGWGKDSLGNPRLACP